MRVPDQERREAGKQQQRRAPQPRAQQRFGFGGAAGVASFYEVDAALLTDARTGGTCLAGRVERRLRRGQAL